LLGIGAAGWQASQRRATAAPMVEKISMAA
jgi:hypothetical protein